MSESTNEWGPGDFWQLATGVQPGDTVKFGLASGEEVTGEFLNFILFETRPIALSIRPRYSEKGSLMTIPWHAVCYITSVNRPKRGTVDTAAPLWEEGELEDATEE